MVIPEDEDNPESEEQDESPNQSSAGLIIEPLPEEANSEDSTEDGESQEDDGSEKEDQLPGFDPPLQTRVVVTLTKTDPK